MVNRIEDESVLCKKKLKLFDYTSKTKMDIKKKMEL